MDIQVTFYGISWKKMRLDIKRILLNSNNFVKEKILISSITHEVKRQDKESVKLYIGYYAKAQFHHTQKPPTPQKFSNKNS